MKPTEVNILGKAYKIEYMDNPSNVDIFKREACWGQIDFWTRSIRIYDNGRSEQDIWHTIWHEVLHGITQGLHLKSLEGEAMHDELDLLAMAIVDTIARNGWAHE